ncbi:glutathione S-transferase [Plenodomus tracheiphilus IPT5]|uniref:Glutathione S-transferase n=1 Tax=Plenodomus tracheiphilus IPT5 TaxID=1408161 RepID=A0A6A7BLX4_9PLEO|nr:glutathione S-transferase [Plenodomus tracheiphilus IPT5]
MPQITLWFLQASRCIRTAWLLEELGLDYILKFSERVNQKAPEEFKLNSGNPLGKFPTLQDGSLTIYESGAISDYLCETYDKEGRLLPHDPEERVKVRQWVHASEATFVLHALAILYAQWNIPKDVPKGTIETMEKGMSVNVQNDLSWLETELSLSTGNFLRGDHVTAADIMMQFSADFILARGLGTQGKEFPNITKWPEACTSTETYQRAVKKTGHKL